MENQNPESPRLENETNPIKQQPMVSVEQETPFYNVLPKNEAVGPVVGPKIQVSADLDASAHAPNFIMNIIQTHKKLVIIILALLILAYPIYYALNKFVLNSGDQKSILNEDALKQLEGGVNSQPNQAEKPPTATPKEWQSRYFGNEICQELSQCGDEADADSDGLNNLAEFEKETDPNNNDSDQDGLADGDEVYIFGSEPNNPLTANDPKYNDGQNIKGGYNPRIKDAKFTPAEIADISAKMRQSNLHQPTITTLGQALLDIYKFSTEGEEPGDNPPASQGDPLEGVELTPEAKQDRDTRRSNTIKNISIALVKFYESEQSYPLTTDFTEMFNTIKPYAKVATNPVDPINKDKYVYTYLPASNGSDFTLTFYSETQSQIIRTRSADAKKYQEQEEAAINDDRRKNDLETLRTALLIYSANNAAGNQEYVFPTKTDYQTALVPEFIGEIPKDPKTNEAYQYEVSENFDSFTLKALLDIPPTGRTGYLCNQEECQYY